MGQMSRAKGKSGEREIAALLRDLTGWNMRRRVRQYDGDSDLVGVPGWSIEVKRYGTASRADIARWWAQTVAQAATDRPVLFYRQNRDDWRAVWPLSLELVAVRSGRATSGPARDPSTPGLPWPARWQRTVYGV
jgi:Holliday junction resolvase